jgi:hypothetical protein
MLHTSVYSPENDYMVVFGGQGGAGPLKDLWFLDWTERTEVSALGAGLSQGGVHLLWQITSAGSSTPALHRQEGVGPWISIANLSPGSDGRMTYTDAAITPGVQYNYGLSLDSLGVSSLVGEISIRVPDSATTPALLTLVDAHADSGFIKLQWYAGDASGPWVLERRTSESAWGAIAQLSADGDHMLRYEDRSVLAGTRYGYRVGFGTGGHPYDAAEVWVSVPFQSSFALRGVGPNPALGALSVSFSLQGSALARLELLDVTGRIRVSRELGALAPGEHNMSIEESAGLPAGIYVVRLIQGSQVATSKACLVR